MVGNLHAVDVRGDRTHRAPVKYHEHLLARMTRGDLAKRGQDAIGHGLVALTPLPPVTAVVMSADAGRVAGLDFRPREARPLADVDLAELRHRLHLEASRARDRLRRLQGSAQ